MLVLITIGAIFVDALSGFGQAIGVGIPASALFRFLIVLLAVMFLRGRNLLILLAYILWMTLCCYLWLWAGNFEGAALEIQYLMRPIYPFLLYWLAFSWLNRDRQDLDWLTGKYAFAQFAIGLLFVFTFVTGLGMPTYGDYAFGHKSFFDGGNDLGLYTLLVAIFCLSRFAAGQGVVYYQASLVALIPLTLLGTRTGWAGFLMISCLAIYVGVKCRRYFVHRRLAVSALIAFISLLLGVAIFLLVKLLETDLYLAEKLYDTLEKGPRSLLTTFSGHYLAERPLWGEFIGSGPDFHKKLAMNMSTYFGAVDLSELKYRYVEQDAYDLIGFFGVPFFLVLLAGHLYFAFKAAGNWLRSRNLADGILLFAVLLFLLHGFFAGHALLSPFVAHGMVVIWLTIAFGKKEKGQ